MIEHFKKSGKPLVAFLRNPGTREYYLATAADKIYITPEDSLDLKGIHIEPMLAQTQRFQVLQNVFAANRSFNAAYAAHSAASVRSASRNNSSRRSSG